MHYEINISLHGKHFFATAARSITDRNQLKKVHAKLVESFKEEDGFSISVSERRQVGCSVDMNELEEA